MLFWKKLRTINPVIPGILKTNEIPRGGSRSPPYENGEGVLLGPYSQKTLLKGANFRVVGEKLEPNLKNWPRF